MLFERKMEIVESLEEKPPSIRANIARFDKEWIKDEDGVKSRGVLKRMQQSGIVMQPQRLSEPVDGVSCIFYFVLLHWSRSLIMALIFASPCIGSPGNKQK